MERITYIDYLKAIGIYLVILGHQPMTNAPFHDWIFTFHMPLFFFASGLLAKKEENIPYIKKNVILLLLVVVPYKIFGIAFNLVQDSLFYRSDLSLENNILNPLKAFLLGDSRMGPMWFLIALFWMRITYNYASWHISVHSKEKILVLSLIAALTVYCVGMTFNYWQITAFLLAFPFYCLGGLLQKMSNVGLSSYPKMKALLFLALSIVLLKPAGHININALDVGNSIVLYYISGTTGILFMVSFCQLFRPHHAVEIFSKGTLVILGLHMSFIQIFKLLYKKILAISVPPPIWIPCRHY